MPVKRQAYLTIDDSPTKHTDELTDFLAKENIPAVLFCIGSAYKDLHLECEGIEQNPGPILRAIEKGFVIANHTYTHRRSSELTFEEIIVELEKTEKLIDDLYKQAGKARPVKLMRFPHLDRGAGGWIVDYNTAGIYSGKLKELFLGGLNINLNPPTDEQRNKKARIQGYLKHEGFTADVFPGVTFPWYTDTELGQAQDCLMTFSTSDWMLNPDFQAAGHRWQYNTIEELKLKIDIDPDLQSDQSAHIILAHDHNNLFGTVRELVRHMKVQGFEFKDIAA